ncbi:MULTISPECIES: hypothetical protein [Streptomyces]|uniref:hypothetical protein n=1 Tax=Streptomyces TaxID=1883 RepID=UPI0004CCCC93|nr:MULTISPECIES: hypothetical protein [Streptomyces]KOT51373.1 hypothetical protein ADK43_32170 [Streptomyces rimosus subsp. rimosus]
MYAFGTAALLGLAMLVVSRLAHRFLSAAPEFRAFAFVALGAGADWPADTDEAASLEKTGQLRRVA